MSCHFMYTSANKSHLDSRLVWCIHGMARLRLQASLSLCNLLSITVSLPTIIDSVKDNQNGSQHALAAL